VSPLFGIFGLGLAEIIVIGIVGAVMLVVPLVVVLVVVLSTRKKDEPRNE
jgi:hypothetical protein